MFWKKKKKSSGEKLVIFFASDLHGSAICFKKFINGAEFYGGKEYSKLVSQLLYLRRFFRFLPNLFFDFLIFTL